MVGLVGLFLSGLHFVHGFVALRLGFGAIGGWLAVFFEFLEALLQVSQLLLHFVELVVGFDGAGHAIAGADVVEMKLPGSGIG